MTTLSAPAGGGRPTMRHVADAAGVSVKTVSRVLNGERGVRAGTARRVEDAVRRLGFRRNETAATLRRRDQTTHTIGFVIEDVSNPFYSTVVKAVEDVVRAHGYLLITASSDADADAERELLLALCARRVDGLLVIPCGTDLSYLQEELSHGTPVVAVDRPAAGLSVDAVVSANADGVRAGIEHLLAAGHRRIGYVGDTAARYTGTERLRGYHDALSDAHVRREAALIRPAHDAMAAESAVKALMALPHPPTAIFTGNNLLTRGAIRALGRRRRGIGLVGYDDFALADLLDPPVTVVSQDATALGRAAADLLFRRLRGDAGPRQQLVLATALVKRS